MISSTPFIKIKLFYFNIKTGAELLLSKKTLSTSAEELLATLQGQVQSLTQKNKDLMEKIQVSACTPPHSSIHTKGMTEKFTDFLWPLGRN